MAAIKKEKQLVLLIACFIFMMITIYMILFYASSVKTGFAAPDAQRIFYIHLPSAIVSYVAFTVVLIANLLYLFTSNQKWDNLAVSSAEIGTILCSFALITGALWAKAEWNTYWRWEDTRLTTFLIVWLIFSSYLALRNAIDEPEKRARLSAVYGIIGYASVPLSYFSMYIWQTLHPIVVSSGGGGLNQEMGLALLFSFITFILIYVYLLIKRMEIEHLEQKLDELKESFEGIEND